MSGKTWQEILRDKIITGSMSSQDKKFWSAIPAFNTKLNNSQSNEFTKTIQILVDLSSSQTNLV